MTALTETLEERDKRLERRRQVLLRRSCLPASMIRDFGDLDAKGVETHIRAARAWADGQIDGVYISGPVGTGKSTLAGAALTRRCAHNGGRWVSVPMIMVMARAGYGTDEKTEATTTLLDYTTPIVLDDIDKIKPSDWLLELLFTAVELRVQNKTPLIVTSNLSVDQLADRLGGEWGPAIASRLTGYCYQLRLGGDDRRLTTLK